MSTRSFPMMVLPVSKALELEEFPKHEDVKQHLVEWQPSMGNVAFFSHTWLSWTHPDGAHPPKWNLLRRSRRTSRPARRRAGASVSCAWLLAVDL